MTSMDQRVVDELAAIEALVSAHFGFAWRVQSIRNSSGRRLAVLLDGAKHSVFAKFTNAPEALEKAVCEAEALRLMAAIPGVRTPNVIGTVGAQNSAVLVLESVEVRMPRLEDWAAVADMVALLHRATDAEFGLERNNYIGDFTQSNLKAETWSKFYADSRLKPMLKLLKASGHADKAELSLLTSVADKVAEISAAGERPALLHGDLWPGNVLFDASGPILIDPAISYGNREMDLAFSQMAPHLSFASSFYQRYQEQFPLPEGHEFRRELWQLWPLLAHVLQDGRKWMPQLLAAASKYR